MIQINTSMNELLNIIGTIYFAYNTIYWTFCAQFIMKKLFIVKKVIFT